MSYQRDFKKRIKTAVIGAGSHCYRNILPTMTFLPVELTAVCDVDEDAAEYTARQYGCKAYTVTEELYHQEQEVEAVFISVGASLHPPLVLEALGHGKHVWVEKPIALRTAQVEEMMKHTKGKIVVAGLKKAFTPAAQKAREIVNSPKYGNLNSILAVYPMNMPETGKQVLEDGSLPNWLRNGVHPLSFMIGVSGRVKTVQALINQAGYGAVILQFVNGVTGTLHLASGPQPDIEHYSLYGDNWQMDIDDARVALRRGIPEFRYRETTNYAPPGDMGGTILWDTNSCVATLENKAEFVQGMYGEMKYFCDCVLENRQPKLGNLESALEVMMVYEAALVSEGRPVEIHPEQGEKP